MAKATRHKYWESLSVSLRRELPFQEYFESEFNRRKAAKERWGAMSEDMKASTKERMMLVRPKKTSPKNILTHRRKGSGKMSDLFIKAGKRYRFQSYAIMSGINPDIPIVPVKPLPEKPWQSEPGIDEPILPEDPGETPEKPGTLKSVLVPILRGGVE